MKFRFFNKITSFCILVSLTFFFGCGGGGSSVNTKSDLAKDFNKTTSLAALRGSILTIPENVQLVSFASSGKKIKSNKDFPEDGLGGNVYGNIGSTIKLSEEIKTNIQGFIEFLFEEKDLANAELGVLIEPEQGVLTGYKIEDISNVAGEIYKWKLSLHYFFSSDPDIICRFTFVNGKLKGQMLQNLKNHSTYTVGLFDHEVYVYGKCDIRFDGTKSPQTLDIDYTTDLSEVFNFANQYWPQLTKAQFKTLDIGQVGNSSIRVTYDGSEYGISGTNYSPGANLESELRRQVKFFGEDRSTYSFRIKSITEGVDGAKMEVAIPVDTLEDISSIWLNDSFSELFQAEFLGFLNEYITQLIDENDDVFIGNSDYLGTALLSSVDLEGTILEEQRIGFAVLYKYLGDKIAIQTLTQHGLVMTTTEFDAAAAFWGTTSFTDFTITSLVELNAFLAASNVTNTDTEKITVFYRVMAPAIITYYQTHSSGISTADVIADLTKTNDIDSNNFKALIETNILIVNPAYLEKDVGLLGTYDGTNFNVYDYLTDTLAIGSKPTSFNTLDALDLTDLTAIKPKDVHDLVIEVK